MNNLKFEFKQNAISTHFTNPNHNIELVYMSRNLVPLCGGKLVKLRESLLFIANSPEKMHAFYTVSCILASKMTIY